MSDYDLIILDLDGGEMLERCLASVAAQRRPPSAVLLVDNGSRVPVTERLRESSLPIRVLRSDTNRGFTGGVNLAWDETTSPFVALVNNDVTLDPEWSEALLGVLERDARAGAVQSIVVAPDGRVDGSGIDPGSGRIEQRHHGTRPDGEIRLGDPWGVSATAAIYRSEAVREVAVSEEFFHPRFFAYYEDVELAARLRKGGWSSRLVERPLAVHQASATAVRLGVRGACLRARNRYLVHSLHPEVGRLRALILEDLRAIVRDAVRLRVRAAFGRLAGLMGGVALGAPRGSETRTRRGR
jgi:N-acetylglucosaminyl-diphospho-decaprenol L-rhamnosyltransferase